MPAEMLFGLLFYHYNILFVLAVELGHMAVNPWLKGKRRQNLVHRAKWVLDNNAEASDSV